MIEKKYFKGGFQKKKRLRRNTGSTIAPIPDIPSNDQLPPFSK